MAASPIPAIFVLVVGIVIQAFMAGETAEGTPCADLSKIEFGGLDILGDIVDAVVSGLGCFVAFLTFQLLDAPWWVEVPLGAVLIGALAWSVVGMIRGN